MASDMFYNYEHHINKKSQDKQDNLNTNNIIGNADMQIIYNIKGEFVGISTKKGNPIRLYFSFEGDIDGDIDISSYLMDFKFSIVNVLHEPLIFNETNALFRLSDNFNELEIYIPAENNTLLQDVYRMQLSCTINGNEYVLFSESDGILEIK